MLYLQHLGEESHSKVAVEEACNAVTWIHGVASIAAHPFVRATLKGLQRTLAKPSHQEGADYCGYVGGYRFKC